MTGGTLDVGPVIEKVSVLHWVWSETGAPPVVVVLPPISVVTEAVMVLGPDITKVFMSIRSWKNIFFSKVELLT